MKRGIDIPKEVLEDLYHSQGKSTAEVGQVLGCSETYIRKKLREYGIKIKHRNWRQNPKYGWLFGR